jgi:hypothetical protein
MLLLLNKLTAAQVVRSSNVRVARSRTYVQTHLADMCPAFSFCTAMATEAASSALSSSEP